MIFNPQIEGDGLMALFWGFVWPWLLIPMHKRPLHGLVVRLITEVDARAMLSAGE